jgi:centrosomal protein CEP76
MARRDMKLNVKYNYYPGAQDYIKYANDWWEDFKNIRSAHSSRMIKLFVPTEDRESYNYKPCNALIEPIALGRGINTPYEAARFVSLLPYERQENPGGEKVERWQTAHTFLSIGSGDVEDHSVLLCNLLLGFGLDAYLAVGISINGPHVWVLTRSKTDNKKYSVTYWESLTGQRINIEDSRVFRFYKRIHCAFNDTKFYANIQVDDTVFNTIYNFDDEFLWKQIPSDKIQALPKYSHTPMLDIIVTDHYKQELEIEREIKAKIVKFRKSIIYLTIALELKTNWDGKLSYLISPALVNYELERIANQTYGNEEFKQSVKNYVPEGYTFKGFPLHTVEIDFDKMFGGILSSDVNIF